MDDQAKRVVRDCTRGSDEGRMSFPEVVQRLAAAGIERYHADLVRAQKTYYTAEGASETVAAAALDGRPAASFSAGGVEQAIRAIQAGGIDYKGFCERILAAGCVGYLVSIAGRRAVYYGRTGELHVEHFPGAR